MKDDLISRHQAIDALAEQMPRPFSPDGSHPADDEIFMVQEIYADCIQTLEALPTAQSEIIRCKDCTYWHDSGKCDCFSIPERNIEVHMDKDGFCSEAERRTDDKTNKGSSC